MTEAARRRSGRGSRGPAADGPTPEQAAQSWIDALQGGSPLAPREPAALRLARWIDWTDAIAMAAALDARGEAAVQDTGLTVRPTGSPAERLAQTRSGLLTKMRKGVQEAVQAWMPPSAATPRDTTILRHAITQAQRQMEASVGRLRASLRAELRRGSAPQRELAALDAVIETALLERQRHLLSGAAGRLARLGENADPSNLELRLMAALAAELELRLQPLKGLVQSLQDSESTHP